jgi:hypothetical protein
MAVVNEFFYSNSFSCYFVEAVCTDDAPAMLGKNSGFTALVKK